jgi:hypothetical protein
VQIIAHSARLIETSQEELTETSDLLHLSGHRLHDLL